MMNVQNSELPTPPGVVASLKAGFDTIASNAWVILLPVLLDVFFWLGPRLSLETMFVQMKPDLIQLWKLWGLSAADIKQMTQSYQNLVTHVNVFWIIRTMPIGIPSLLMGQYYRALFATGGEVLPAALNPYGPQTVWAVNSDLRLIVWLFSLVLIGWFAGALYFRWVASLVVDSSKGMLLNSVRAIIQTILFSIIWSLASWAVGIPFLLIFGLLAGVSPIIAEIVFFIGVFFSMWLVVPIFFSIHGIFVTRQNALISIWSALRMARFTMPNSSLFVMSVFVLGFGLNYLWSIAPVESWITLVGIFGHAFVTTALLAASFIFYRDSVVWIQVMLDHLKSNPAFGREQLK